MVNQNLTLYYNYILQTFAAVLGSSSLQYLSQTTQSKMSDLMRIHTFSYMNYGLYKNIFSVYLKNK